MPGITGIVSSEPADLCNARLNAMLEAIRTGQQSQIKTNHATELGLYTGWTPANESVRAPSLESTDDQSVSLLLSGECHPDGPSILDRYQANGPSIFEQLNGLYSGILIDRRKKQAFLFNDRFGAERIYVHESKNTLYFASEAKALLTAIPALRQFDHNGVAQFLTYGCTINGNTLFSSIKLLPGGSVWTVENAGWTKKCCFSSRSWEEQPKLSVEDFTAHFGETFNRILSRYFHGDQSVGIALTGGLDSRMILACLPENITEPICYTYTAEKDTIDTQLAERVAAQCGLEHRILRLESDFFSNFAEHADRTVSCTDGCSGILGSHEIYLSRKAREVSAVRLTGNYGSEILRNVSTFKSLNLDPELLAPEMRQTIQACERDLLRSPENPICFALFKEIPWNLAGNRLASQSCLSFRTPYLDNELCALAFQAPDEILRSPQTALQVISRSNPALTSIPTNKGLLINGAGPAYGLRRTAYTMNAKLDYYCNEGLPDRLSRIDPLLCAIERHSRFFGKHSFLHYRKWFRTNLADYLQEALFNAASPYWNPRVVQKLAEEHISGRKNRLREINVVLTLDAVDRLLLHPEEKVPS